MIIFETNNIPNYIKNKLSLKYAIAHNIPINCIKNIECTIIDCKMHWGLSDTNTIQQIIDTYKNYDDLKSIYIFLVTDSCDVFDIPNNVKLFRTSLLKSKKKHNEYLLPYIWEPIEKQFDPLAVTEKPIIGFCGLYSIHREKIIQLINQDDRFTSNFILRQNFWGGNAHNDLIIADFQNNMQSSHFNICNRGAGNFSMRFYQTLSSGRIPVLVNTDMLLPYEDEIDWNEVIIIANTEEEVIDKILYYWKNKDIVKMQRNCKEIYNTYFSGSIFLNSLFK